MFVSVWQMAFQQQHYRFQPLMSALRWLKDSLTGSQVFIKREVSEVQRRRGEETKNKLKTKMSKCPVKIFFMQVFIDKILILSAFCFHQDFHLVKF